MRIADEQGFRFVEVVGSHADVTAQMRRHRYGHAILPSANAATDGAAALQDSFLL